ncbi:MAG: hypothetical protein IJI35_01180 [Kiritimatiellae bacterium]|nr:hypothetical protein [Kiritimatiellia bacterium]
MKMSGKIGFGVVGLTTMLAFAVNAALPSGYTELEYVESVGSPYLDTGVVPATTTRVVCDFRYVAVPTARSRNGWTSTGSGAFWFGTDGTDSSASHFGASVSADFKVADTGVALDTGRHTFDISTAAIKFDGAPVDNPGTAYQGAGSGNTMYLFASRHPQGTIGAGGKIAIYSCQIYDGDTLVRDFVPARRASDNAVGLYDRTSGAEKVFYVCEGGGALYGSDDTTRGYYAVMGALEVQNQSSISGTALARGWTYERGGTKVAMRGITEPNARYHVWNDVAHRTPAGSYATPGSSSVVVEPGVTWTLSNMLTAGETLTLNNVTLREGAVCEVVQSNGTVTADTYIAGTFAVSNGAALKINSDGLRSNLRRYGHLAATVTGTGAIEMSNTITSGDAEPQQSFYSKITGDLSGFRGDIVACNGATNGTTLFHLSLVNASSIPGDPAAGDTARVVVANGAWLRVNHDWDSPANRVWDFGSGRRPVIFVDAGKTVTIGGGVIGSSGFVKAGQGTLVLTRRGSLSGACEVIDGKLRLEGGAAALAPLFRRKGDIALPAGYTMLESLSLAGGANDSYIDTGYTPQSGAFGFFFDYMPNVAIASGTGSRVMGSSPRDGGAWGGVMLSNWAASSAASGQVSFGGRPVDISAEGGQVGFTRIRMSMMDGRAELSRGWSDAFDMRWIGAAKFCGSVYVGNVHCSDSTAPGAPMSVYRYKIFESERLVHDFVPVKRTSDGAVGLYDTFGGLGFRPAADAQYVSAGPAYSGSDSEWLEVVIPSGFLYILR